MSQIAYQDAKRAYEDYKAQKPEAPVMSDYTGESSAFCVRWNYRLMHLLVP